MKHKITVILPCRNEGAHLDVVVKRIPKFVDEIIVVSNRSTDNTVKIAKSLGLKVYVDDRTFNGIGYGFAHMTGIEKATGKIIAALDGDATYPIEDLKQIIDVLLKEKIDFVSCSRYPVKPDTKIPFKLRLGVWLLNTETRILYGKKVNDILSGMWVFRKEIKDELKLTMGDWNLSPQIKINAITNPGIKFKEFSIAQHSRYGETKQRHFSTGFSHMLWILKNRLNIKTITVPDEN